MLYTAQNVVSFATIRFHALKLWDHSHSCSCVFISVFVNLYVWIVTMYESLDQRQKNDKWWIKKNIISEGFQTMTNPFISFLNLTMTLRGFGNTCYNYGLLGITEMKQRITFPFIRKTTLNFFPSLSFSFFQTGLTRDARAV